MKFNEVIAEKQWHHQALVDSWPSWTNARRQYILLVVTIINIVSCFLLTQDIA